MRIRSKGVRGVALAALVVASAVLLAAREEILQVCSTILAIVFEHKEASMPHPTGETLRCDECGAEIVFTKACPCPEREPKMHSDVCCGKEMRVVGSSVAALHDSPARH